MITRTDPAINEIQTFQSDLIIKGESFDPPFSYAIQLVTPSVVPIAVKMAITV